MGRWHRILGFVAVVLAAAILLGQLQAVAEAATVSGASNAGGGGGQPRSATATPATTAAAPAAIAATAGAAASNTASAAKATATGCSPVFAQLWAGAASGQAFSYAGPFGTVSFATAIASGPCVATGSFTWTGSFSLFGGQITAAGLSGTVTSSAITMNAGTVRFPAAWNLPAIAVAAGHPLVITFGATPAATTITGALSTSTGGVPLLTLPGLTVGTTTLTFTKQGIGVATSVTLGATATAQLSATVDSSGNVTGSASVTGLSLLGQSVNLAGGFRLPAGGSLSSAVTATIPGPVAVASGLTASGLTLTIGSAGLTLSGTAQVGVAGTTETVAITGTLTSLTTWSLVVTTPHPAAWTPLSGLTITPNLTGTIAAKSGAVTYSMQASGSAGSPLASWKPAVGANVSVASIKLGTTGANGDIVLTVNGKVTVGGIAVPVTGQVDLNTGGIRLKATTASVPLSTGVTLTSVILNVTGNVKQSTVSLAGTATAAITAAGVSQNVTAKIQLLPGGALVVGAQADLGKWGLGSGSIQGQAYWATATVAKFQTGIPSLGNNGVIALPAGLSAEGTFTIPSAVAGFLTSQLGLTIPANDTVAVMASLGADGAFAFTASLGTPTGFPVVTLPAGITLGPTSVTFTNHQAVINTSATLSGNGGQATLQLGLDTDGSFSGTASLQGVQVFGTSLDLTGALSGDGHGGVTSHVSATLTQTLAVTPGLSLAAGTTITLGTGGLAVSGTATIGTGAAVVSVSIDGTLTDLRNWSLTVSTPSPVSWNPTSALHISASFSGTISDSVGAITFAITASGAGTPLATWQPTTAVGLSVDRVTLSNGPSTAPGVNAGDVWVSLDAQATLNLPGANNVNIAGHGVLDLTSGAFSFTTQVDAAFTFTSGGVTLNGLQVTLTGNPAASTWSVQAGVTLTASLPHGINLNLPASISYRSGGAFVVAVSADLSSWLGAASDTHLFLASEAVKAYPTGDPALGALDLPQGLSIAEDFSLPANIVTTFGAMGIPVPSTVLATAAVDLTQGSLTLSVTVGFGPGLQIFSANGASLVLIDGTLKISVGESTAFSLSVDTTLNLPAMGANSQASGINLSGSLSFSLTNESVDASLTITAGGPAGQWQPAFGIPGLSLVNLTVQGGVSFGGPIPLPNLGFAATVNALPGPIANLLGYQQGAPIAVAVNINTDAPLVDLSIGTPGGPVALEPLASVGSPSVIQISYAKLYLAAVPVTLGGTTYPAGFELSFSATVSGVPVSVVAQVDPNALNVTFYGSLGSFGIGDFQVGGATLDFHVGSDGFRFKIDGSLSGESLGFAMSADLQLTSAGNFQLDVSVSQSTPWLALYTNLGGSFGNGSWYVTGSGSLTVANLGSVYAYLSMGSGTPFQAGVTIDNNPYTFQLPVNGFTYDFYSGISGSGSVTITDGVLAFSGSFSGSLDMHLSTFDGFYATASVSVDAYVTTWQTDWCYWMGIPYPCGSSPVTNYLTSFTTSAGVDISNHQFTVYVDYGVSSYGIPMQF